MTNKRLGIQWKLCLGLGVLLSMSATADLIYDNSVNDRTNRFRPGTLQVGDEIILAGGARYLTNFSFEFYGTNGLPGGGAFTGQVQARVRLHVMDPNVTFNVFPTPSQTPFYDSLFFPVPTTDALGRQTFVFTAGSDFPAGGLFIPASDITWSVQFSGMLGNDDVGLDIYDPVVVGANYPDYWERDPVLGWQLKTNINPLIKMNFAARMYATPEPSSVALLVLGGLGLLFASRRSRKQ